MTIHKREMQSRQLTKENAPKLPHGYTLELVANVAAVLAAGHQPANRPGHLLRAAKDAVILVQACENELLTLANPTPAQTTIAEILSDFRTIYPKNSFRREVKRILNRDSWTEAQPIFKEFLRHQRAIQHYDPRCDLPRTQEYLDAYADRAVKDYQSQGLGGMQLKLLEAEISHWYSQIYLHKQRSKNGKQGGRPTGKASQIEN